MNYNIFRKIITKSTILSIEYKNKLLQETRDFSYIELGEIIKGLYEEEEKIIVSSENIRFKEFKSPIIKTKKEIQNIKKSGRYLNNLLRLLNVAIKPGIKLIELELLASNYLSKSNIQSSFIGVDGYKYNISICVNNKIIHGIPNHYRLKSGDLITVDAGVNYEGGITDSAFTTVVGGLEKNIFAWKMLYVLKMGLDENISYIKPGTNMYDFTFNFYSYIIANGFSIIKNSSGHGVGRSLHEEPSIYNWPCDYMKNLILKPGMIIAIEPLITGETNFALYDSRDTAYTNNGDIGGYFEYTILITIDGYKILSGPKDIIIPDVSIEYAKEILQIGSKKYILNIADTTNKQFYGLMFKNELGDNEGMLFKFKKSEHQVFTMRNTLINLDIIGIDKNMKVIFLKGNVKNYYDLEYEENIIIDKKVRFIIELKSGEISKNGIKINDII